MTHKKIHHKKSIKYHVLKYLLSIQDNLKNKVVIDIPAGSGITSEILLNLGANVEPYDLFPEYFAIENIECKQANASDTLPIETHHADVLICQEGIEHFSDQLKALKEFNRVLKPNGMLIITTPSYSNLSARLSYLLFESEASNLMPPNEIDDVWMSDKNISNEIYHGHIFLIGLQKLRTLGKLAGFQIFETKFTRISKGSLVLFPILYPFILLRSFIQYHKHLSKHPELPKAYKKRVYGEQLQFNIGPKYLLDRHSFVIFKKEQDVQSLDFRIESVIKPFYQTT